jgi:hypothetical protein
MNGRIIICSRIALGEKQKYWWAAHIVNSEIWVLASTKPLGVYFTSGVGIKKECPFFKRKPIITFAPHPLIFPSKPIQRVCVLLGSSRVICTLLIWQVPQ